MAADPTLPVAQSGDSGTPSRPLTEGWHQKIKGESKPPMVPDNMLVDICFEDNSRIFGWRAGFAGDDWSDAVFWREHEAPQTKSAMDQLAEAAGLTRKPDRKPEWNQKMLGAPKPQSLSPSAIVDVVKSNDQKITGRADHVPDWNMVVRWRLNPEWMVQGGHEEPPTSEREKKLERVVSDMQKYLRELIEAHPGEVARKTTDFLRELHR